MKQLARVDVRAKLDPRRDPYWLRLSEGRYVGFRKMAKGSAGTWLARFNNPEKPPGKRSKSKELGGYDQSSLGDFAKLPEGERFDAAKLAAEKWFAHLAAGGSPKSRTVREACERYTDAVKIGSEGKSKKRGPEASERAALSLKEQYTRIVYSDPIAKVDLGKLRDIHVEEWKGRRMAATAGGKKRSLGTYNREATALRAALNYAQKKRMVPNDHAWIETLKPFEDADGARDIYLKPDERKRLLENASDEARALFKTLTLLPLRPGDPAKLLVRDLNINTRILRVPSGKAKAREIPLPDAAFAHFKECAKGKLPTAWLISRADGSQWKKEMWRNEIKLAAAGAKLPKATVAYTLRHSVITDLVKGGLDLFHVAKLAGSSIAMIEKHYGQVQAELARAALGKLALMGPVK